MTGSPSWSRWMSGRPRACRPGSITARSPTTTKAVAPPSLAEQVKAARAAVAQSHSADTFVHKLPTLILGLKQELLTVGPVRSTHDEAVLAARLFQERGWRSVLLVTSPTHTRGNTPRPQASMIFPLIIWKSERRRDCPTR